MQLLIPQDLQTMTDAAVSQPLREQTSNNERRARDLQIAAAYAREDVMGQAQRKENSD
jgi:hypothetical protein